MQGKELFRVWAPIQTSFWSKYAKPVLFTTMGDWESCSSTAETLEIPGDIKEYCNQETMFIVDLEGARSVEAGLGLANMGFRPVPMYNVVNETKTGHLKLALDNTEILDALTDGIDTLLFADIDRDASPAFLIDHRRLNNHQPNTRTFDNRWSVEPSDFPEPEVLIERGIKRIVVWCEGGRRNDDLTPILRAYYEEGFRISFYKGDEIRDMGTGEFGGVGRFVIESEVREGVRKFEAARFGFYIFMMMGIVNFVGMMLLFYEPFLYTAPSIMWLTYLWVPEAIGDMLAFLLVIGYGVVWFGLKFMYDKRTEFMRAAACIVGLEVTIFFIYVFYYGIHYWMFGMGWMGLIAPIILGWMVIQGLWGEMELRNVLPETFYAARSELRGHVSDLQGEYGQDALGTVGALADIFSAFRGYGGSGRGGYGGYGGYGGGYGGGFGG